MDGRWRSDGDDDGDDLLQFPVPVGCQNGVSGVVLWNLVVAAERNSFWKIGTLAFLPSNSENIHFLTFLEPKITENRQLALWLLLIG